MVYEPGSRFYAGVVAILATWSGGTSSLMTRTGRCPPSDPVSCCFILWYCGDGIDGNGRLREAPILVRTGQLGSGQESWETWAVLPNMRENRQQVQGHTKKR